MNSKTPVVLYLSCQAPSWYIVQDLSCTCILVVCYNGNDNQGIMVFMALATGASIATAPSLASCSDTDDNPHQLPISVSLKKRNCAGIYLPDVFPISAKPPSSMSPPPCHAKLLTPLCLFFLQQKGASVPSL